MPIIYQETKEVYKFPGSDQRIYLYATLARKELHTQMFHKTLYVRHIHVSRGYHPGDKLGLPLRNDVVLLSDAESDADAIRAVIDEVDNEAGKFADPDGPPIEPVQEDYTDW